MPQLDRLAAIATSIGTRSATGGAAIRGPQPLIDQLQIESRPNVLLVPAGQVAVAHAGPNPNTQPEKTWSLVPPGEPGRSSIVALFG
jgi:hypothetical protein